MKVGFVCTNYNNASYTRDAVASLRAGTRWNDVRVVVVDNKSADADVAALTSMAREFPEVDVVLNPANVGYFPGLNVGIQRLRTSCPDVEHVVIGNNDLVFPGEFVESMQRHRNVLDTWAVVAPDIVTLGGLHQNPHVVHPISRARRWVWDLYYLSYGMAVLIKHAARTTRRFTAREETTPASELYKTPGTIALGFGACYVLGPTFFSSFGQLYAPTFMMQEEFFLSEQVSAIGQRVYYEPRFTVWHHDHATTDRLPSRRTWEISQDAHRVYRRYLALSRAEQLAAIAAGARVCPPGPAT